MGTSHFFLKKRKKIESLYLLRIIDQVAHILIKYLRAGFLTSGSFCGMESPIMSFSQYKLTEMSQCQCALTHFENTNYRGQIVQTLIRQLYSSILNNRVVEENWLVVLD